MARVKWSKGNPGTSSSRKSSVQSAGVKRKDSPTGRVPTSSKRRTSSQGGGRPPEQTSETPMRSVSPTTDSFTIILENFPISYLELGRSNTTTLSIRKVSLLRRLTGRTGLLNSKKSANEYKPVRSPYKKRGN